MQLGFFLVVSGVLSALKHDLDREKERALKDPLTDLPNRRAFDETARAEIRRSARYGRELSLAFLDLDDFKIMNDQMGHHEGDRLLVRVADAIRRGVRAGDIVARVGGDEFLLFFPETGSSEVNVLLTRIRSELDLLLSLEDRRVTASIGAVTFVKPEGSVDAMVKMADQLMYVAKKNGKNRVEHRIVRGAHDDTRSANA